MKLEILSHDNVLLLVSKLQLIFTSVCVLYISYQTNEKKMVAGENQIYSDFRYTIFTIAPFYLLL